MDEIGAKRQHPRLTVLELADGASVGYSVSGKGRPLLYMTAISSLPIQAGFDALAQSWDRLREFSLLITFDRRGHGVSHGLPPRDIEQELNDIDAVREAVGVKQLAILGESNAGALAILYAAAFPERVTHLILAGAMACNARDPSLPSGIARPLISDQALQLARADVQTFAARTAALVARDAQDSQIPIASYIQAAPSTGVDRIFEMYCRLDTRPVLGRLQIPTLVIHSKRDRAIPVAHGRYLARRIRNARYLERDASDHLLFLDETGEAMDAIEEFLAE